MRTEGIPGRRWGRAAAGLVIAAALLAPAGGVEAQQPRRGGTLAYAVSALPPSFDAHRETTFAMIHPIRPHYNLLVKFDPQNYPRVVPDLAESWTTSRDGTAWTFKLRQGVKFHDGSTLTSRDVKASFDKIIFPPEGVVSVRQAIYQGVRAIEAPDANTVVFRLKWPVPSFLEKLASPFNWIYKADILARDPRWYERNVMGTGPFRFVEYVRGARWVGRRNEDYFDRGKPYLDGYTALFIGSRSALIAALKSGQALIEFRGVSPAERDDLVRTLGNRIVVQEQPWLCNLIVAFNTRRKPFDDARVRRALTLAVDRWGGSRALSQIAFVGPVGAVMRPGSEFAMPEAELTRLAGYGRDITQARAQARALLREAGVPDGFAFTLKNRDVQMPYEPVGIFLVDQWRQIGLNVQHVQQETAKYLADMRAGDYEASVDFACDFIDDPDVQLAKFVSSDVNPLNYGGYIDRQLDLMFVQQSRTADPAKRLEIVRRFERRLLHDQVYAMYVLWWQRIVPHWRTLQGYKTTTNHYVEPDLAEYWLADGSQ
ncbi:MAG: ABC transporter substrate-binding protein [Armatimonadota bacterium]|nr:ABC transporter substrate-binding protein [Armatimonadota bacterium]MDR7485731.1 ABC transporter substrate-binding protein [Armatimonadota bacterium]MDR7534152.1 ABC transporter substrate-binding protein [Armatimonadota bacterium]MDR7536395.1 ABC transporter substrate-binding protein [Armatimonadota bacterium]